MTGKKITRADAVRAAAVIATRRRKPRHPILGSPDPSKRYPMLKRRMTDAWENDIHWRDSRPT